MGLQPLTQAPRTFHQLFPELKTLEEKAFKFLEVYYEQGKDRRVARVLNIDPKTVKSINEFLLNTDIGLKFNALLLEQTEDFYSAKNLTSLFEGFQREIQRVEDMIKVEDKLIQSADELKEMGELAMAVRTINSAEGRKLKLVAEKRMWMGKLLDASLACRPLAKAANKEQKKDEIKTDVSKYADLLHDFDPGDSGSGVVN
jgi:hypothetical protein